MGSDFEERALDLFARASELEAGDRGAFLDRECAGDDRLRAEVELLLRHEADLPSSQIRTRLPQLDSLPSDPIFCAYRSRGWIG